jgi:ferredoxin
MAAGTVPIQSDPTLWGEIRRYGKFDASGCYQCGSCTLSCDLVDGSVSFPRKSIRYGMLGLRGPLLESLEPWVCHDCGDCSVACPRQAEPRTSMMTLRRFLTAQYDWTGISTKVLSSRAWYLGSLVGGAAFVFLLILVYHLWRLDLSLQYLATTPFGMEHMFPLMTYYTLTVMLVPLLLVLSRILRIWRLAMRASAVPIRVSDYFTEAWTYAYHSVTHTLLRKCPNRGRWLGHWLLALGTVMMLTIKTFALRWFQTDNIYPLYHPQRWLGYLAAAFIIYGVADILYYRLRTRKEPDKETRVEDWTFPILLLLTALTGLGAHVLRYAGFALACHFAYALHVVVATPMLVVEMSFGKWSHMIYRPLALYFLAVKARAAGAAATVEALHAA